MTDQHDHEQAEVQDEEVYETGADDLADWEPPKQQPPEQPYVIHEPTLARVRRAPVMAILAGAGVLAVGGVGYALVRKPVQQERALKVGKASNERPREPDALADVRRVSTKQRQDAVHTSGYVPQPDDKGVDPGWLTAKAVDPVDEDCQDKAKYPTPTQAVECEERKAARLDPLHQNVRGLNKGGYAAAYRADNGGRSPGANPELEDESALEPPPMQIGGGERQGGGQVGQGQQQPSVASPSPVMVGMSPADAHRMAQRMVGEQQDGDPEAQKERFMAQGGIQTLGGGSEDLGECDMSAGTPVHGSILVAINSDLPAQNTVTFKVNRTVYCGADHEHVAIPQGSTFVGSVDQRVTYGQERIQLCMKQLQRPKSAAHPRGDRKQLGCFVVADITGASGMPAEVDNHWGAVIGGSLLSAILSLGTSASMGDQTGFAPTLAQGAVRNAGQNLNQAGQRIVQRDLSRKPTLTTQQLEDAVILFSSNLEIDPWEPVGAGPKIRRVAAW